MTGRVFQKYKWYSFVKKYLDPVKKYFKGIKILKPQKIKYKSAN